MVMRSKSLLGVGSALLVAGLAGYGLRVYAEGAPTVKPMFYAGTLEASGRLASGAHSIALTLYDAETAGNQVCVSQTPNVPVEGGRFRVEVSADCVTKMRAQPDVWVELKFTGPDGVPHELPLRTKVGAMPYAMEAQHAVSASSASSAVGALGAQVVPAGAVMAFDLEACPPGWTELATARGRTIVGTNPSAGAGLSARARGAAFGAESAALAAANLPPHSHSGATRAADAPGGTEPYRDYNNAGCGAPGRGIAYVGGVDCLQNSWREHTHPFTTGDGPGASQPFGIVQPSLALLYCKKN
jgi:hypothetical protein